MPSKTRKPKTGEPRPAETYRSARRPEAIKLAKQRRRELLERELKARTAQERREDPHSRNQEAARRRRQMAAGKLQR